MSEEHEHGARLGTAATTRSCGIPSNSLSARDRDIEHRDIILPRVSQHIFRPPKNGLARGQVGLAAAKTEYKTARTLTIQLSNTWCPSLTDHLLRTIKCDADGQFRLLDALHQV